MTFTPCASSGMIFWSTTGGGVHAHHARHVRTVDVGIHEPDPRAERASATARFTATVDLPTPPLPLDTAITRPRFGYGTRASAPAAAAPRLRVHHRQRRRGGSENRSCRSRNDLTHQRLRALQSCAGELRAAVLRAHGADLGHAQLEMRLDPLNSAVAGMSQSGQPPRHAASRPAAPHVELQRARSHSALGDAKQRPQPVMASRIRPSTAGCLGRSHTRKLDAAGTPWPWQATGRSYERARRADHLRRARLPGRPRRARPPLSRGRRRRTAARTDSRPRRPCCGTTP